MVAAAVRAACYGGKGRRRRNRNRKEEREESGEENWQARREVTALSKAGQGRAGQGR